jgi:hypothetical protein
MRGVFVQRSIDGLLGAEQEREQAAQQGQEEQHLQEEGRGAQEEAEGQGELSVSRLVVVVFHTVATLLCDRRCCHKPLFFPFERGEKKRESRVSCPVVPLRCAA